MEMSPGVLREEIKMLVTRMLDCFIPKFRTFVTEMIKNLCGPDQNFVQLTQEAVG